MIAHKITLVLALALLVLLGFAVYGWFSEHDARLRAELTSARAQKDIDSLKAQQQQNGETLRQQLAVLELEKTKPATPQQIVLDASHLIPALPAPLEVQTKPVNEALPDGPKVQQVVIPTADLSAVRDYGIACEETADKLAACTADDADLKKELALTGQQRDAWKKAASGGSIWHRAATAAKWMLAGAIAGYVVERTRHR
jgi:hypothetical protein